MKLRFAKKFDSMIFIYQQMHGQLPMYVVPWMPGSTYHARLFCKYDACLSLN